MIPFTHVFWLSGYVQLQRHLLINNYRNMKKYRGKPTEEAYCTIHMSCAKSISKRKQLQKEEEHMGKPTEKTYCTVVLYNNHNNFHNAG